MKKLRIPKKDRSATVYSRLSEKARKHVLARSIANVMQKRGKITPLPCEICGTTYKVEKHHPDYDYPLVVMWLCKPHHLDMHHPFRKKAA